MSHLNLAHWYVTEAVNGPGRRFTVWVQGCPRRCPGCFNPALQAEVVRQVISAEALAEACAAAGPVDGFTLSGGEPFAQAAGLTAFLGAVEALQGAPLPVIAFSGYTLEELRRGPPAWGELLARVDLLVDGPFLEQQASAIAPLTGSANQRRLALSPAGAALLAELGTTPAGDVQVHITAHGEVVVSGFPAPELLAALRRSPPQTPPPAVPRPP